MSLLHGSKGNKRAQLGLQMLKQQPEVEAPHWSYVDEAVGLAVIFAQS